MSIPRESRKKGEMWAEKVLRLFRCLMKEDSEGDELAFVRCMECVPSLENVEEALKCVHLQ